MDNLPAPLTNGLTPLLSKSLSLHELDKHRAQLGLLMEVQVKKTDKFGWDRMSDFERNEIRRDWMDALQDYPLDEVRAACRQAILDKPNKTPNEGHVRACIQRRRAEVVAANRRPEPVAPRPERVSPERAAEIMGLAGFSAKRMGWAE